MARSRWNMLHPDVEKRPSRLGGISLPTTMRERDKERARVSAITSDSCAEQARQAKSHTIVRPPMLAAVDSSISSKKASAWAREAVEEEHEACGDEAALELGQGEGMSDLALEQLIGEHRSSVMEFKLARAFNSNLDSIVA